MTPENITSSDEPVGNIEHEDGAQPLGGLRLLTGEITPGSRPKRTLRIRNARVARSFDLAGKRVLDIGCAEGLHCLYMAESAQEVVGIDHRASVIARANANKKALGMSNVTFKCCDIRDPKIYEGLPRFNLVVAWGFLHRIADIFSFLQALEPMADALSLEWRTPVLPFMYKLSAAYHSTVGDALDPMNLEPTRAGVVAQGQYPRVVSDNNKIEGSTGFWDPTPGAVRTVCGRLGYKHARLLGYGENLQPQGITIMRCWGRWVFEWIRLRKPRYQIPIGRVHMVLEKRPGSITINDPMGSDVRLPVWDHAIRSIAKGRA